MNKYERRSKANYDKIANNYDNTFDGKFTRKFKKMLYESIDIHSNDKVLDVACGNGCFLHELSKTNSFIGFGVDISEKMIKQAQKLNPSMNYYVSSCDQLPFKSAEIDIITVCAAFHHFPNINQFAKETKRVLKKNGMLYIAEVYLPLFLRLLCNPFVKYSKAGDVKFYSSKEIITLFKENDFQLQQVKINGMVQIIQLKKI